MRPRKAPPGMNVTAFIDVLLVLIVSLMLAMQAYVKRMPVDLPSTSAFGAPSEVAAVRVAITKDGRLLLNDRQAGIDEIVARAKAQSVELAVDKDVPYERLAQVLSVIQGEGPREVTLLTF